MTLMLDSNIILDLIENDETWTEWTRDALRKQATQDRFIINPIIYSEVSVRYKTLAEVDAALSPNFVLREPIPYEAAFLAGKAFVEYRRRGGIRSSPLPDFFIGAHALVAGHRLITRDAARYRTYFPQLDLIAPG